MKNLLMAIRGREFRTPLAVLFLALFGLASGYRVFYVVAIAIGLVMVAAESFQKIRDRQFSLDYIAILAMVVALATQEFGAGAVIALMVLLSAALEAYGSQEAEAALKNLVERIPKTCQVRIGDQFQEQKIQDVREGEVIVVRPQEVIPLDGYLLSEEALMDESNLTGEIEPQTYARSQFIKSGFVNTGASVELRVFGDFSGSTYQKIVDLVREAKKHPARIVRLAERYNYIFTVITLALAGAAYLFSHDLTRLLAVLVIATPCPLLIAAPVSFLGGLNKASKQNIIIKKPAALETLSRIKTIFFDKTGTLTLGEPGLRMIEVLEQHSSEEELLAIAAAIERHSLHPLAKAIVRVKDKRGGVNKEATQVAESIGKGIAGTVEGVQYQLRKSDHANMQGIVIDMFKAEVPVARFTFDDVIKAGTMDLLVQLRRHYGIAILTGDTKENADRLFGASGVRIYAQCLPEDKFKIIKDAQAESAPVMMVGDGLNDAPALALADVGMVFSGTENSASIDAAAVAILSHDVKLVQATLDIAQASTRIALQSILWGIGLSLAGMVCAAFGLIPPVAGAIFQEAIDISVVLNALRAAR